MATAPSIFRNTVSAVTNPLTTAFSSLVGGLPAGTNQNVGMKPTRPGGGSMRPMTRPALPVSQQRPGNQQMPQMPGQVAPQQQQQQNSMLPLLLMMMQNQQQQRPPQQQQQPQQSYNQPAPWGGIANYASMMGTGAQYAQNNAMQNAVAQGNNAIVGGPLQSVSSPSGNNIQNNGLYQASMIGRGGGESMNQYFGDHNTQAYRLGFNGMDDPRYTAWVQSGGLNGPQASGAASGGTGAGTGTTGGKDGALAPTGTGGTAAAGTTPTQDLLGNLFNDYQAKLDASNAANEQRYSQGLNELTSLRSRSQNDINRLGAQQARDIRRDTTRTNAAAQQQATQRGLGNSTLPGIMARGVQRDSRDALNRLGDTVAGQRLNADNQLTGNITNWIYNRNDNAPDFGQLIDLARLYGESGAGQPQQNLGVPQLPPLDLSGLQGLFNGLGNLGAQLPQLGIPQAGGGYQQQGQGQGSMPAGAYGGGNLPGPGAGAHATGFGQLAGSLAGLYGAPYLPQVGQAIGQGVGNFMQSPYQSLQNVGSGLANGATGAATGLAGLLAQAGNLWGNAQNGLEQQVFNSIGQPSSNNNWLTGAIQGVRGANSWLGNLFGR